MNLWTCVDKSETSLERGSRTTESLTYPVRSGKQVTEFYVGQLCIRSWFGLWWWLWQTLVSVQCPHSALPPPYSVLSPCLCLRTIRTMGCAHLWPPSWLTGPASWALRVRSSKLWFCSFSVISVTMVGALPWSTSMGTGFSEHWTSEGSSHQVWAKTRGYSSDLTMLTHFHRLFRVVSL